MTNKKRSRWDLGRLWQILTYFEIIPVVNFWQRLFSRKISQENQYQQTKMKILVVGATGGVGKRVVKLLLEQGYDVVALIRDAARGKQILGIE